MACGSLTIIDVLLSHDKSQPGFDRSPALQRERDTGRPGFTLQTLIVRAEGCLFVVHL